MESEPKRTSVKNILILAISLSVAILFCELIIRLLGFGPWHNNQPNIQVSPGNKFFQKHHALGYSHIPGKFEVTLNNNYKWRVTHLENTLRVTKPLNEYKYNVAQKEIWIFGCSYTHGWSIDDEETYPWVLQKRYSELQIINFGVTGYGTIHSWLQLQEALLSSTHNKNVIAVILAYADFHDARNTFARIRRKGASTWNFLGPLDQPYARLSKAGDIELQHSQVVYRPFPLIEHLAFMNFIEENFINRWELWQHKPHQVTKKIIEKMINLALENNIKFVLAEIGSERSKDIADFTVSLGGESVDMSFFRPNGTHTNLPHDGHPSPLANHHYAKILGDFLEGRLRTGVKGITSSTR